MQNSKLESFLWRVWNTFKTTALPVIAIFLLPEMGNLNGISELLSFEIWDKVLLGVVASILGSVLAGADKVIREENRSIDTTDEE
jgi:hypothetical protein